MQHWLPQPVCLPLQQWALPLSQHTPFALQLMPEPEQQVCWSVLELRQTLLLSQQPIPFRQVWLPVQQPSWMYGVCGPWQVALAQQL